MKLKRYIEEHENQEFDLIIIGGGITGAAVAYAASSRNLKVALFEKKDYGGATSAATSKLIHGGLRYLANMEFKLVRESLQERRILGNIAPNFVYPLPFMFPNYVKWKGSMWKMMIGMFLYDTLSYDKKYTWDKSKRLSNHKTLSYNKTIEAEPNIIKENLRNSTVFYDYQSIFPERLTLAFIKSAVEYGAKVSNYSKVENFSFSKSNKINGVVVKDVFSDETKIIYAPLTINCGGTWADIILNLASKTESSHKVLRSEGIHIITKKIAGEHAVSLQKKEGGHMMIMPWRGHSLIGTTDKEYNGSPDNYKVSKQSLYDVIDAVNNNYNKKISYDDIIHAYGGLRPLVDDQTEDSYNTSRRYEVLDNATEGIDGLITVEGGKFTTSRNLAYHVMKLIQKKTNKKLSESFSYKLYLSGCEIKDMNEFMRKQHLQYDDFFGIETVEYISRNYGTQSHTVFQFAIENPEYNKVVSHDGELLSEVVYAIRYESAMTLKDILLRRTGIGTLGKPNEDVLQKVMKVASEMLNWTDERKQNEYNSIIELYTLPS
ncbi:MAG: glycerol-3-phosphate dehydrogenase/oxidase [Chlorobi bacterium]|nr:glycerol-3-phosphate dehydrogenase/oxidase [Chlorobiota bacterium]